MNNNIKPLVKELSLTVDDKTICLGLFEKESDLLRTKRLIENNNYCFNYQFHIRIISNPKLIDYSFKKRVF